MAVAVTHSKTLVAPDSGVEDKVYGVDYVAADSHIVSGLGALATQDTVTSAQISDATATGKSVLTAADAAAARTAIGAGTGNGTVTSVSGTAPIASSGGSTPAISLNDAGVTYAKIQNVSATSRFLGRISAAAGVVEELTAANAKTILALTSSDVGLGSVTNDAQTKAAVVPNTAPSAGQVLVGNAGGTAYAATTVGGDATLSSAGSLVVTKTNGSSFGALATKTSVDLSSADATGILAAARFPALTGDVTTVAGALAATIGAGRVTRAMLEATGKNWQFLGQATASNAVRTGTITWTGTFKQLIFEYFIAGYSGSAIGRLIVGPTSGLSETATNHCNSLIEGVTLTTTSVSVPGWPTATTAGAVPRYGYMFVQNVAASVKRMWGQGNHSGTAATAVPTQMQFAGLMSDATNLINKAELAVYALITGTTISSTTFNSGTYLNVWGRNDD